MYCVYCITRDDGLKYIGKAKNVKNRICAHKKTKRFINNNFTYEVLFYSDDHELICDAEHTYIQIFDTYKNGLNDTSDGTGNNHSDKFTTFGFKFSDESKLKMSSNHYLKKPNTKSPMLGRHHTIETKKKWSDIRKGKAYNVGFSSELIEKILLLYKDKPPIEFANMVAKNGRYMDYESAFCKKYHSFFQMSIANMKRIIKGESIHWKPLYEKILDLKF